MINYFLYDEINDMLNKFDILDLQNYKKLFPQ